MRRSFPTLSIVRLPVHRRGTVLILVIWVALSLASLALYFGNAMLVEYRAADNTLASREADQAIEGARRYITQVLTSNEEKGKAPDINAYLSEKVEIGNAAFWMIGRQDNSDQPTTETAFGLIDESSKLNINTASLEMLQSLPGMTPGLAAAIVDWRDADSELSPGGAESANYLMLDPAYNCKNSRFETIEELRLVLGMDLKTMYGEDSNFNGILEANENDGTDSNPEDNTDGKLDSGIMEYVTVFSREANTRQDGSARINIAGDAQALWNYLNGTLGAARSAQIRTTLGPSLQNIRSILEFYIRASINATEAAQIEDALTVSSQSFIEGRININTASSVVMACLPGVGQSKASDLVSFRQKKTADELKSVAWVLGVLDPQTATEIGPYITTHSYQFSADLGAVGHHGRGFRRNLLVFDTTGASPILIYRRDLTRLGWPLGNAIREEYEMAANS